MTADPIRSISPLPCPCKYPINSSMNLSIMTTVTSNNLPSSFTNKKPVMNSNQVDKIHRKLDENPWSLNEDCFQAVNTFEEKLKLLIRYAILAPSTYNLQPWRFKIIGNSIELYADKSRTLPILDRLAATHFGLKYDYEILPDLSNLTLLARISFVDSSIEEPDITQSSDPETEMMFHAITKRRTDRNTFERKEVPKEDLEILQNAVKEEHGVWLETINDMKTKKEVAHLIAQADVIQADYLPYRKELATWLHPTGANFKDGVPASHFNISNWMYYFGTFLRTSDWGKDTAKKDRILAEHSPAILVLGTLMESDREWFFVGQALARVLLLATAKGLVVSQMNQPIELPDLRGKLQEAMKQNTIGLPQVVLRIGYKKNPKNPIKPSPRRPLGDVLMTSNNFAPVSN